MESHLGSEQEEGNNISHGTVGIFLYFIILTASVL